MERVFVDDCSVLVLTAVVGVLAYGILIAFLRLSGKRTLAKVNAFDLVVTVALGSTLAGMLLSKDVALAQGALAFALLIGLQFTITWSSVRTRWVRRLATGEPSLLLYRGEMLQTALRRARVTDEEIRAAGHSALGDAEAVVLETDGSFSVVEPGSGKGASSLADVERPTAENGRRKRAGPRF